MNNDNIALAINENEINDLSLKIIECADQISLIFDEIDKKVESINDILKASSDNSCISSINNNYDQIKSNYKIVHNNILSYSDDLISLVQKMSEGEKTLVNIFDKTSQNTKDQIKEVN